MYHQINNIYYICITIEKQLRDAAAAEVATYGAIDDSGKSVTRKRKVIESNAKVQDR